MTGRALIVDDTQLNLQILQNKLEREYYTVFTANSGEESVRMALEINPDIILMNAVMRGMDGFNAIRLIRTLPKMVNVPIIITTALNRPEEKVRGRSWGR